MEAFREPRELRAGAEAAGDVLRVLPELFHLMWTGALYADLGGSLLGSTTLVHTAGGLAPEGPSGRGLAARPYLDGGRSEMRQLSRPAAIAVGERVRFAGEVRAVLAVAARAVTLTDEDGSPIEVPLAMLLGNEGFELLSSSLRMPLPPVSLLEALPERAREKALWWERHSLEALHGLGPDASAGSRPRPEYDPARSSLTARERAKAAELTATGYRVSVSTISNFRRRYLAEGLLGLADRRPVRKKPQFGTVDDTVVEAMRQAVKEGVDDSTRTGTYILWRTGEILREKGETVELPSSPRSTGCWRSSPRALLLPRPHAHAAPGPTEPRRRSASGRCSRPARWCRLTPPRWTCSSASTTEWWARSSSPGWSMWRPGR